MVNAAGESKNRRSQRTAAILDDGGGNLKAFTGWMGAPVLPIEIA